MRETFAASSWTCFVPSMVVEKKVGEEEKNRKKSCTAGRGVEWEQEVQDIHREVQNSIANQP